MSDKMHVLNFESLVNWILKEYETRKSVFGIHESMFFNPESAMELHTRYLGHDLATPVGPAAGPHTQLAQNIICAWLVGGRFIELKTVQIMDELDIPRPCIDMSDEGYNVEWSQELKLSQSAGEYIKAWVLIHMLRRLLGFEKTPFGTIFNMSVGYDLKGIRSDPVTRFMDRLKDASAEIDMYRSVLARIDNRFDGLDIPHEITDNVTLSTMHGCPPDEIERIAKYLLEERGLHTTVKLNPTLLGREEVLSILRDDLGYEDITIPPSVFDNDLKYDRALALIRDLQETAKNCGRIFGIKLSNTLAVKNTRQVLPGEDMYMSGRALFPITVNLMHRIRSDIGWDLNISFSAGADAFNISGILASGAFPVTVASDLLKPGGYARMTQYIETIRKSWEEWRIDDISELKKSAAGSLTALATEALEAQRYKKNYHPFGLPKTDTGLTFFDCIEAPCRSACAVRQDIPEYLAWIERGEPDRALEVILSRNPLPGITGYVCTHLCRTRCTRNNYDQPVGIRALKRYALENGKITLSADTQDLKHRVAVIGGGPSGLAAAYYLRLNGFHVTIFEAQDRLGGMIALAPPFRIPGDIIDQDIKRIVDLGVDIELNHPVDFPPSKFLEDGFDAVYIATGFQKDTRLDIPGVDGESVWYALDFLNRLSRNDIPEISGRILVIGGGNTAMDAARSAQRLAGQPVTVVYRRTRKEMPAEDEEITDLEAEGNQLMELVSPLEILRDNGRVTGLKCIRNKLGDPGPDGRPRPEPVRGSEFVLPADGIIIAIGQQPDITFLRGDEIRLKKNGAIETTDPSGHVSRCLLAGGDAVRGPSMVIQACADGMAAAEAICNTFEKPFKRPDFKHPAFNEEAILRLKQRRTKQRTPVKPPVVLPVNRTGFDLVESTYSPDQARKEASRCLQCHVLCDKCVEVCPNRANIEFQIDPVSIDVPVVEYTTDGPVVTATERFEIRQNRQILHIDDFCNECGNCATFCVHDGKPYKDKPRLFLTENGFKAEEDNAFFLPDDSTVLYRKSGETLRLQRSGGRLVFESERLKVVLGPDFKVVSMEEKAGFEGRFSLRDAAVMHVVMEACAGIPFIRAAIDRQ